MKTAPANQTGFSPLLFIVPALILIGALGSSPGGPIATTIGGVGGLVWGLLVGFTSTWLDQRWPNLPRRWVISPPSSQQRFSAERSSPCFSMSHRRRRKIFSR